MPTDRDQPPLDAAETAPTGHPPLDAGGPPAGHYPRSLPGSAPHAAWMDSEEKRMWEIRGRPHLENRPPTTWDIFVSAFDSAQSIAVGFIKTGTYLSHVGAGFIKPVLLFYI